MGEGAEGARPPAAGIEIGAGEPGGEPIGVGGTGSTWMEYELEL